MRGWLEANAIARHNAIKAEERMKGVTMVRIMKGPVRGPYAGPFAVFGGPHCVEAIAGPFETLADAIDWCEIWLGRDEDAAMQALMPRRGYMYLDDDKQPVRRFNFER